MNTFLFSLLLQEVFSRNKERFILPVLLLPRLLSVPDLCYLTLQSKGRTLQKGFWGDYMTLLDCADSEFVL